MNMGLECISITLKNYPDEKDHTSNNPVLFSDFNNTGSKQDQTV
jgi:hypothetical protein